MSILRYPLIISHFHNFHTAVSVFSFSICDSHWILRLIIIYLSLLFTGTQILAHSHLQTILKCDFIPMILPNAIFSIWVSSDAAITLIALVYHGVPSIWSQYDFKCTYIICWQTQIPFMLLKCICETNQCFNNDYILCGLSRKFA